MDKKEFYKTINILVSTSRIDNEEAYIINNYVSGLENIIKEVREYIKERTEFGKYTYAYPGILNQDEVREINRILDKGE